MIKKISIFKTVILVVFLGLALVLKLSPSVRDALTNIKVGKYTLPLAPVFFSILIFLVVMTVTHLLQAFLKSKLLVKTDLDKGMQATIISVVGYIGLVIGFFWILSELGIDFKNLAVVAGALTVGIGFGLQNVVNNFISGIILLFGRAMKVGDHVIINGKEGIVRQINIRSTELETDNNVSILIPNANILATDLTNLTHQAASNAASIAFTAPLSSDALAIRDVLLGVAQAEKGVLDTPAPFVLLKDANGALQFELVSSVADVNNKAQILSDLRFKIVQQLKDKKLI